jgi:hypothetical protein
MTDYLNRVKEAANTARNNAAQLEARLKAQIKAELAKDATAVDIAAAEAFRSGLKKVVIGRAMGTQDYNTYNDAITRGLRLIGSTTSSPNGLNIWSEPGGYISIQRGDEVAIFAPSYVDGARIMFFADSPLWDESFSRKNTLVAELDQTTSGDLYDAVTKWMKANEKTK